MPHQSKPPFSIQVGYSYSKFTQVHIPIFPNVGLGVNCLTSVGSSTRLPFLSGLQGQGGMENSIQPVPTTNPSPVSAPYHGLIAPNNAARTAALHNNLATLAETIAQATSLIQAAGLGQGFLPSPSKHVVNGTDERSELMGHLEMLGALSTQGIPLSPSQPPTNNNYPGETYDPSYCSVKLPTPQPLAPMDSPVGERYLDWNFTFISLFKNSFLFLASLIQVIYSMSANAASDICTKGYFWTLRTPHWCLHAGRQIMRLREVRR